MNKQDS